MLDTLDKGEFTDIYVDGETPSQQKSRTLQTRVRSSVERHEYALKLLKAASFTLDICLPAPAEVLWKLFLLGGNKAADALDSAESKTRKCCTIL